MWSQNIYKFSTGNLPNLFSLAAGCFALLSHILTARHVYCLDFTMSNVAGAASLDLTLITSDPTAAAAAAEQEAPAFDQALALQMPFWENYFRTHYANIPDVLVLRATSPEETDQDMADFDNDAAHENVLRQHRAVALHTLNLPSLGAQRAARTHARACNRLSIA
jgi:hypothetical protein